MSRMRSPPPQPCAQRGWGGGDRIRLIGTPERTWDWPHLELADDPHGYRSVDDALAAAHNCSGDLTPEGDAPCLPELTGVADAGGVAGMVEVEATAGREPERVPKSTAPAPGGGASAPRARVPRGVRRIE